jgi:hypothetical protein
MTNPFISPASQRNPILSGIASDIVPVTPSDTVDLAKVAFGLYVEGAGAVAFISASGASRVMNVTDFSYHPVGVVRVLATGTTATGISALVF